MQGSIHTHFNNLWWIPAPKQKPELIVDLCVLYPSPCRPKSITELSKSKLYWPSEMSCGCFWRGNKCFWVFLAVVGLRVSLQVKLVFPLIRNPKNSFCMRQNIYCFFLVMLEINFSTPFLRKSRAILLKERELFIIIWEYKAHKDFTKISGFFFTEPLAYVHFLSLLLKKV